MAKVIGIDFGTTNSCMAIMEGGEPRSWKTRKAGASPLQWLLSPKRASASWATRPNGRPLPTRATPFIPSSASWAANFDEVQEEIKRVPYKVVRASNGDAAVEVEVEGKPKQFSPPEISAMILAK